MAESSPLVTLAENEAIRSYDRKRKAVFFEHNPPKKPKSHVPLLENINWNPDKVLSDLQSLPQGEIVNRCGLARKHGLTCKNSGQVVKEFARSKGLDVARLDCRPTTPRSRASRRKLQGGEISMPSTPIGRSLQESWKAMVHAGTLTLGKPCVSYTIRKYFTKDDGSVEISEDVMYGRKISLLEIRQKMLKHQEKFMHLYTDVQLKAMSRNNLETNLTKIGEELDSSISMGRHVSKMTCLY